MRAGARTSTAVPSASRRVGVEASGPARRHPDRRTAWVIVLLARLEPGTVPEPAVLLERLGAAEYSFPLMASRLRGSRWVPGPGPGVTIVRSEDPLSVAPLQRFLLAHEPPLRVVSGTGRDWLLLCGHHFAFDGLGMVALVRSLLTGEDARGPKYGSVSSPRRPPTDALRRLLTPADRVAPSLPRPADESFVARSVPVSGPGVTPRLARACAAAAVARNVEHEKRARRIGLSVAVGGVRGEAATYRRIDVVVGRDVETAVRDALHEPDVPTELVGLPRGAFLLRPLLSRLSDTVLVSNLGRLALPGVTSLEFYPVARGRSAVAFGAAGVNGGPTTLTLRARDLWFSDAASLLERAAYELARRNGQS